VENETYYIGRIFLPSMPNGLTGGKYGKNNSFILTIKGETRL
jgi:hypothetical protein